MNVTSATLLAMTMSRKGRELLRLALPFVHAEIHRLSQVLPERGPTKYYLYLVYVYTHTHTKHYLIWPYQTLPSTLCF